MEPHPSHNPGDPDHLDPELQRLRQRGIDLSGATRRDDALAEVIGEAIEEALASGGEVPVWGARAIARALADRLADPIGSALHTFAISGQADADAIRPELVALYHTTDTQTKEWVDWLGTYLGHLPEETIKGGPPTKHNPKNHKPDSPEHDHPELDGIDLTGATQQDDALRDVIGTALIEASAINGEFPAWGARALARALADRQEKPTSGALHRFAVTGHADTEAMGQELAGINEATADEQTKAWVNWLSLYMIDSLIDLPEPAQTPDNPRVGEGIGEHGDAFRAFLTLPDTDPQAADLLARFEEFYVGAYASISELADALTELPACTTEVDRVADRWGFEGLFTVDPEKLRVIADAIWDIVAVGGKIYVFSK